MKNYILLVLLLGAGVREKKKAPTANLSIASLLYSFSTKAKLLLQPGGSGSLPVLYCNSPEGLLNVAVVFFVCLIVHI